MNKIFGAGCYVEQWLAEFGSVLTEIEWNYREVERRNGVNIKKKVCSYYIFVKTKEIRY